MSYLYHAVWLIFSLWVFIFYLSYSQFALRTLMLIFPKNIFRVYFSVFFFLCSTFMLRFTLFLIEIFRNFSLYVIQETFICQTQFPIKIVARTLNNPANIFWFKESRNKILHNKNIILFIWKPYFLYILLYSFIFVFWGKKLLIIFMSS